LQIKILTLRLYISARVMHISDTILSSSLPFAFLSLHLFLSPSPLLLFLTSSSYLSLASLPFSLVLFLTSSLIAVLHIINVTSPEGQFYAHNAKTGKVLSFRFVSFLFLLPYFNFFFNFLNNF
jgi:hypothetical protein